MKKKSKILIGVIVVAAVVAGGYFANVGGLQGRICMGRNCNQRRSASSSAEDLAVKSVDVSFKKAGSSSNYKTDYLRFNVNFANVAPAGTTFDWKVFLTDQNGKVIDYTKNLAQSSLPTSYANYAFEVMTKSVCNDSASYINGDGGATKGVYFRVVLDPANKVSETDESNNFYQDIYNCASNPTEVSNSGDISRALFSKIVDDTLINSGKTYNSSTTCAKFSDVDASYWYAKAVCDLNAAGLVKGYTDGKFHPNDPVTRAEAANIFNEAYQLIKGPTMNTSTAAAYVDVDSPSWYYNSVQFNAPLGITDTPPWEGEYFYPDHALQIQDAWVFQHGLAQALK